MTATPQWQRLLEHLQNRFKGRITRLDAWAQLGICELARCVRDLEQRGYVVEKHAKKVRNRYGETVRVTEYSLQQEPGTLPMGSPD